MPNPLVGVGLVRSEQHASGRSCFSTTTGGDDVMRNLKQPCTMHCAVLAVAALLAASHA